VIWGHFIGGGRIDRRGFMRVVVGGGIFAGAMIFAVGGF